MSKIIGQAGGTVTGTVSLTQEFVEANSAEKLQIGGQLLGSARGPQLSTKLVDQGSQAGDLLGIALLINANPAASRRSTTTQRDTVLAALRDTGFITYQATEHIGAANAALVVTGGSLPDDAGNQGRQRGPVRRRAGPARLGHAAGRARRFGDGRRRRGGDPRRRRNELGDQHRRQRRRRVRPHHRGPGRCTT